MLPARAEAQEEGAAVEREDADVARQRPEGRVDAETVTLGRAPYSTPSATTSEISAMPSTARGRGNPRPPMTPTRRGVTPWDAGGPGASVAGAVVSAAATALQERAATNAAMVSKLAFIGEFRCRDCCRAVGRR